MVAYEIVLSNGRILDGCGNPWFRGDLAIQGNCIAAIAPPGTLQGGRVIPVDDHYIAPGFIDIHTHSDLAILVNRRADSAIRQGVTTHVIGNCGMSPAPVEKGHLTDIQDYWGSVADLPEVGWGWRSFKEYLNAIESGGIGINIASLAGHAAIRMAVMGNAHRDPSSSELKQMISHLTEALAAGAFGLSTGLVYPPGCFANTNEIIALCREVARFQGFYASHIRGERETILEAVREAIHIGSESGIPVQVSHNAPKYGARQDATANLQLVDEARSRGQDVTVDNDVHTDLAPALFDGLPQQLHELTDAEMAVLLNNPVSRQEIRQEIILDRKPAFGPVGLLKHGQWQRITILHSPAVPSAIGRTIADLAGAGDPFDVYFDLIIANGRKVDAIFDYIDEKNIRLLLQHPASMICSDGEVSSLEGALNSSLPYSPCSFGEFPGVLERYVYREPVLTLQEAIRKMTSFPAQRLGLHDRGVLHPAAKADIVVFNLERLHDRATNLFPHTFPFENYPHQYPQGIDYVFVNGILVMDGDEHTGALTGQVLRRGRLHKDI